MFAADNCAICMNILVEPIKLLCSHIFCQYCLEELIESSAIVKCPMCRAEIPDNLILENNKVKIPGLNMNSNVYKEAVKEIEKTRGERNKFKRIKILYGNKHKNLNDSNLYEGDAHEWIFYLKTPYHTISDYIESVEVNLHPTFRPNKVILKKNNNFELKRLGWGVFQIDFTILFRKDLNKENQKLSYMLSFEGDGRAESFILQIPK